MSTINSFLKGKLYRVHISSKYYFGCELFRVVDYKLIPGEIGSFASANERLLDGHIVMALSNETTPYNEKQFYNYPALKILFKNNVYYVMLDLPEHKSTNICLERIE